MIAEGVFAYLASIDVKVVSDCTVDLDSRTMSFRVTYPEPLRIYKARPAA